jgi:hypothetical protein
MADADMPVTRQISRETIARIDALLSADVIIPLSR